MLLSRDIEFCAPQLHAQFLFKNFHHKSNADENIVKNARTMDALPIYSMDYVAFNYDVFLHSILLEKFVTCAAFFSNSLNYIEAEARKGREIDFVVDKLTFSRVFGWF